MNHGPNSHPTPPVAASLLDGLTRYHCARVPGLEHIAVLLVADYLGGVPKGGVPVALPPTSLWERNCSTKSGQRTPAHRKHDVVRLSDGKIEPLSTSPLRETSSDLHRALHDEL